MKCLHKCVNIANPLRTLMEQETRAREQRPGEDRNQLLQIAFYLGA